MKPNQTENSAPGSSEDEARVFELALSLVPAAEALARRFHLSSDIGHEVMMQAAEDVVKSPVEQRKQVTNMPAYLFAVGRYLMLAEFKRKKKEVDIDKVNLATGGTRFIENQVLVSEIVQRMSPKARAIFRYRTLGYGYGEIAKEFRKMGQKSTQASLRSEFSKSIKRIIKDLAESEARKD